MGNVWLWSGVLIAVLAIAFLAVTQIKKRLVHSDDLAGAGFTLSDLRALYREGKLTEEEFEKAKQVIVGAARKNGMVPAAPPPSPAEPGPNDPG